MGSPHTGANFIWPLAHMTQALTTTDVEEQVGILKDLVVMASGGGGVQHESVSIDRPDMFTRAEFGEYPRGGRGWLFKVRLDDQVTLSHW